MSKLGIYTPYYSLYRINYKNVQKNLEKSLISWREGVHVSQDHNYCRNADGESGCPWCYTLCSTQPIPDVQWEYCPTNSTKSMRLSTNICIAILDVPLIRLASTPIVCSSTLSCVALKELILCFLNKKQNFIPTKSKHQTNEAWLIGIVRLFFTSRKQQHVVPGSRKPLTTFIASITV